MALRGRRHWLAIDGLGGPSYKFPQFLAASGIQACSCAHNGDHYLIDTRTLVRPVVTMLARSSSQHSTRLA